MQIPSTHTPLSEASRSARPIASDLKSTWSSGEIDDIDQGYIVDTSPNYRRFGPDDRVGFKSGNWAPHGPLPGWRGLRDFWADLPPAVGVAGLPPAFGESGGDTGGDIGSASGSLPREGET